MEIKIENNLSVNEYNNLRSTIGWELKEADVVQKAIENSVIVKKQLWKTKLLEWQEWLEMEYII